MRGVTFQPIQDAGRNDGLRSRTTIGSSLRKFAAGSAEAGVFGLDDLIPSAVQSRPDLHRLWPAQRPQVAPITALLPRDLFVAAAPNTVAFERYPRTSTRGCLSFCRSRRSGGHVRQAGQCALLLAGRRRARGARLREHFSRGDHRSSWIASILTWARSSDPVCISSSPTAGSFRSTPSTPSIAMAPRGGRRWLADKVARRREQRTTPRESQPHARRRPDHDRRPDDLPGGDMHHLIHSGARLCRSWSRLRCSLHCSERLS